MLARLPIALALIKSDNTCENLHKGNPSNNIYFVLIKSNY